MSDKEHVSSKKRLFSANCSDEDLTPTNHEATEVFPSLSQDKVRLCVSPPESENSSGGSTPDANILNEAPFEIKLHPKSATKNKPTIAEAKAKPPLSAVGFLTPEKVARPLSFRNLSPRSVRYEFSTRHSSGTLRPVKIRRSYQSLFNLSITDQETVTEQKFQFTPKRPCRAKSEDWSRAARLSEISPHKRISSSQQNQSNCLDDRNNNVFEIDSDRKTNAGEDLSRDLQNLSVESKSFSTEDDDVF